MALQVARKVDRSNLATDEPATWPAPSTPEPAPEVVAKAAQKMLLGLAANGRTLTMPGNQEASLRRLVARGEDFRVMASVFECDTDALVGHLWRLASLG